MYFLPFSTIKTLTLRMDHAKLLDVLKLLPVSRSILPRAVYFATSRPANHAICCFIDSSGYASRPIRRCLFIDYIIKSIIAYCKILTSKLADLHLYKMNNISYLYLYEINTD